MYCSIDFKTYLEKICIAIGDNNTTFILIRILQINRILESLKFVDNNKHALRKIRM